MSGTKRPYHSAESNSPSLPSHKANFGSPLNMHSPRRSSMTSPPTPRSSESPLVRPITNDRQPSNGLRLAPVPKYHPSIYRSPATSSNTTPTVSRPTSRGLLSPRAHVRNVSDTQMQQEYQRQMLATLRQSAGLAGVAASDAPMKPLLLPHDSPGPATPLNLEEGGDYLTARSIGEGSPRELADRLVREEQERRSGMRVGHSSPAISPRC